MAASQRPTRKTASRSTPETSRCTHAFEIAGYSMHKGLGTGTFIRSATFDVGGHDWCIRYYPDGVEQENCRGYISVYLELLSNHAEVRVLYDWRLTNLATRCSTSVFSSLQSPTVFNSVDILGFDRFKKCSELEASPYLRDDRLVIECDLTVVHGPLEAETVTAFEVQAPPSDLSDNLGKLLEAEEEADVNFEVKGVVFPAHRIVLAMRSPVFKAELYGPMRDKRRRHYITIEDMQPAVFKALLHFIYTDSLPFMADFLDGDEEKEMVKHLLEAADRYAMERMKLVCESILCESLDVESVATTLALADQHHCSKLKDACVEFITSTDRMDEVVASQGFVHLKRSCPTVIVDVFESATKSRKI